MVFDLRQLDIELIGIPTSNNKFIIHEFDERCAARVHVYGTVVGNMFTIFRSILLMYKAVNNGTVEHFWLPI